MALCAQAMTRHFLPHGKNRMTYRLYGAASRTRLNIIIVSIEKTIERVGKVGGGHAVVAAPYHDEDEHVDIRQHIICALVIIILLIILIHMTCDKEE